MLQKLKRLMLHAGTTQEAFARIQPDIQKNNHARLKVFSIVTIVFLLVMVIVAITHPSLGLDPYTYLISLVLFSGILILEQIFGGEYPTVSKVLIWLYNLLMGVFAIVVGTVANEKQLAGTFLAFITAIPLMFIKRPLENIILIIFFDILFIVMSGTIKETALFRVDMLNALVFGGVSMVISSFIMEVAVENLVIKDNMTRLAGTDQLTKLRNRTSYEWSLPTYPSQCRDSLACVYADVNGLHELNNTKGHEAGDVMLWFAGKALQDQFGVANTYRIGGDEFLAFAPDVDTDLLESRLKAFRERVEAEGYYVSVGYRMQPVSELNMDQLVKEAEDRMYAEKRRFYTSNSGREIRNRNQAEEQPVG